MISLLLALCLGFNDMALKNQIENIPAASMGVRNDVDAFHTPEGALQVGRNVINEEGSLRVRPGHEDLGYVSLAVGSPVDSPNNLPLSPIKLVGDEVVMDGQAVRLDDLTTFFVQPWIGSQYVGVSSSFQSWFTGKFFYQVVNASTYATIFGYDTLTSALQRFSVQVNAPLGVSINDVAVVGGMFWFNDSSDDGIYKAAIDSAGGIITATKSLTNQSAFHGATFGNGDGMILARGISILIENGETTGSFPEEWATSTVIENSAFHVGSDGNIIQSFVDPNETKINVYEWRKEGGQLKRRLLSVIEGSFTQEKIYSIGSLSTDQAVIWHNSSSKLFATTNGCNTFMSEIDITGYLNVLGIYDGDVYLEKTVKDIWYIPLFAVASTDEAVSLYQFDATVDDNLIVAAINEDLYYVGSGIINLIGDLGGTANPDTQVSRAARPVFRTFQKGSDIYLVWTDVEHGVVGWNSDNYFVAPVSASGVSGGRGLMVLANRLLKLGGSGSAEIEVDVSAFNDWETGWGTVQVSLLGDTPGKITGGSEISALQGAIFKEDAILHAIAQVEFGGVSAPFRFEQIVAGINGPMSQHVILKTTEGYSMFMGRDGGVYVYDGARVHDLGRHVRNLVEKKLDFMFLDEAWGVFNPVRNLALFVYTSLGSDQLDSSTRFLNRGVIVDAQSGSAWEVTLGDELQMTCAAHVMNETELSLGEVGMTLGEGRRVELGDFDTNERMVMCCFSDGRFAKQVWDAKEGAYNTDMGTAIDVEWETGAIPFGGLPHQFKTVQEGFHTFDLLNEQLNIRVNRYDRDMKKINGASRVVGPGDFKTSHRETGRMFTVNGFGTVSRNFRYTMSSFSHRVRGQR